ncbi:FtsX-like permease family protein [Zunongwangia sp. F363]|uniref:FtsX-like permease family protein n=1 Tax=Autumnicola tepida TaxID=3075595 RepID=A0ABU3CDW5_9FLAO|nr:FtsX-like permease family protein [Zunongwangia sp. F363]MDT0644542.1 FtsX-like permease family protein [Zunongwangia sp. F363]
MFRNYFKTAWRSLWKEKTFTFLNVFGLSVAFGVAVLLSIYAFFELSFDNFHEKSDNIYQLYHTEYSAQGAQAEISNPIPLAGALQEEVPGIAKISRFNGGGLQAELGEKQVHLQSAFVDPEFFDIFTFPVAKGDQHPVQEKSEVAITKKAAINLFGKDDALGKTLNLFIGEREVPFKITSVMEDLPVNSSLKFDIALNFKSQADRNYADAKDRWDHANHEVYIELANGVSVSQFEKATRDFTNLHFSNDIENAKRDGIQPDENGQYIQQRLFSIRDVHFGSENNGIAEANRTYPYLLLGVAFLILLIASVNFVNMSIARSSQRLREIGMRKTLGAGKGQLFLQFWGESILVFLVAVILGILLAKVLLEPFQTLFNTVASFENVVSLQNISTFILGVALITFIAGGYPALLLSKLGTLKALKGKLDLNGGHRLRNALIVVQFSIAILLISGTLILREQLNFMRTKDLGFNKEQVISFPLNGKKNDARVVGLLRNELQGKPGIESVSAATNILGLGRDHTSSTSVMGFDYKGRGIKTNLLTVDYDFPKTVGLEIIKGRSFDRSRPSDSTAIIINEAMAKQMGDEDILSSSIILDDSVHFPVIGVVKNYNFQDLDKQIEPLTLFLNPGDHMRYAYVKVSRGNLSGSLDQVRIAWNKIEPNVEFLGSFLDENIDRTLRREQNMATMITSGSVIAIILSCVGLFAISLLVVSQRRKEIGIRKVVGASVSKITIMLTSDFLKLVGIAFIIATPIAWYFSGKWLENYPFRIDLSIWVFLLAGIIAILIAVFTISFRTIRAAIQNPVRSLRTE